MSTTRYKQHFERDKLRAEIAAQEEYIAYEESHGWPADSARAVLPGNQRKLAKVEKWLDEHLGSNQ